MRCAAAIAKRTVIDLRVAAGRRCSGASQCMWAPYASATIRPVSAGKLSHGRSAVKAKNSRSQWVRYSCHFWSARRSSTDDLISTIQISPRSLSATRSARRPEGSGNSATQAKPSERNSRAVPRATASAVSDWRRSGGGTRWIWRAGDSMLSEPSRFRSDAHLTFPVHHWAAPAANWYAAGHDFDLREPLSRGNLHFRGRTHWRRTTMPRVVTRTLAFATLASLPFLPPSAALAKPAVEVASCSTPPARWAA